MNPSPGGTPAPEYPVFIRRGDARAEVDILLRSNRTSADDAGLHKTIYAAQADQTVVMVTGRDSPLAGWLRQAGWLEPRDEPPSSRS